jgi:hypothetical protein
MYRVKLIAGMLGSLPELLDEACGVMAGYFGAVDYRSGLIPFVWTRHYEAEMGAGLIRQFVSFKNLIEPAALPGIKRRTVAIEKIFSSPSGDRRINLDPGYVEGAKLVLATTKNYDHRICLADGIYAEVTLHYRRGSFIPWEWTYPDYRTPEYIGIFNHIRSMYMRKGE